MAAKVKLKNEREELNRLLREQMLEVHLKVCLSKESRNFFFVDLDIEKQEWNARKLFEDFKKCLKRGSYPAYPKILAIHQGNACSLATLIMFNTAVRAYMACGSANFKGQLKASGLDKGLPDKSVVPSLYMLNRERSRSVLKPGRENVENPKNNDFESVPVFDYLLRAVGDKELARHLSSACHSLDATNVVYKLMNHCIDGTKTKEVRVTSKIACGIFNCLRAANPDVEFDMSTIFTWNPSDGQGKGKKTSAMPVEEGNSLPILADARHCPDFE